MSCNKSQFSVNNALRSSYIGSNVICCELTVDLNNINRINTNILSALFFGTGKNYPKYKWHIRE